MRTLLKDVQVRGRATDVMMVDGTITAIAPYLRAAGIDELVHGHGGAAIPGLHDHHIHLLALAAARRSLPCGPPEVSSREQLRSALSRADGIGWIRGVGYHESVAGDLDRWALDALVPDRPIRIQHRSGALWMFNSVALQAVRMPGHPDGRLWRMDAQIRSALEPELPDLTAVGNELMQYGITGVTDATPDLGIGDVRALVAAAEGIPQSRVMLLGAPNDPGPLPTGWSIGPVKLLLHDHDLPDYPTVVERILAAHEAGRAVAVHCVTRESLLLTLAAIEDTGAFPGDRIEHGAVIPGEVRAQIAALGLQVVTQPSFVRTRGDAYRRDVVPEDQPLLYPWASLTAAGVGVAPSSDAPYGELDPWQVIADARDRRTSNGHLINADEAVSSAVALHGYLTEPDHPGGPARQLRVGGPADVCLLTVPMAGVLAQPHRSLVRRVWCS